MARPWKGWTQFTTSSMARLSIILTLPLAIVAEREYRRLARLPASKAQSLPALSIVVPARNEADNLPGLLQSLGQLRYPGDLECIVVDDDSQDETAATAKRFGVGLLQLSGPPAGWKGKAYACHRGAMAAQGEWLLFVDADTRHTPDGPSRAIAYAERQGLDGLSAFLPNEASGTMERLALMTAYAAFFVSGPRKRGTLNGQFILLRRQAYEASGGFSAVRDQVTEDLALGNLLQRQGYRVPIVDGEELGHVRMYRRTRHLWHGLARFSVASLRWSGPAGAVSILFTILLAAPLQCAISAFIRGGTYRTAFRSWLASALAIAPWAGRSGGYHWAILAPFGAAVVQIAAIWGILRRWLGLGVRWKDRHV